MHGVAGLDEPPRQASADEAACARNQHTFSRKDHRRQVRNIGPLLGSRRTPAMLTTQARGASWVVWSSGVCVVESAAVARDRRLGEPASLGYTGSRLEPATDQQALQ